jgi:hypothetical protein
MIPTNPGLNELRDIKSALYIPHTLKKRLKKIFTAIYSIHFDLLQTYKKFNKIY